MHFGEHKAKGEKKGRKCGGKQLFPVQMRSAAAPSTVRNANYCKTLQFRSSSNHVIMCFPCIFIAFPSLSRIPTCQCEWRPFLKAKTAKELRKQ